MLNLLKRLYCAAMGHSWLRCYPKDRIEFCCCICDLVCRVDFEPGTANEVRFKTSIGERPGELPD